MWVTRTNLWRWFAFGNSPSENGCVITPTYGNITSFIYYKFTWSTNTHVVSWLISMRTPGRVMKILRIDYHSSLSTSSDCSSFFISFIWWIYSQSENLRFDWLAQRRDHPLRDHTTRRFCHKSTRKKDTLQNGNNNEQQQYFFPVIIWTEIINMVVTSRLRSGYEAMCPDRHYQIWATTTEMRSEHHVWEAEFGFVLLKSTVWDDATLCRVHSPLVL